jgi:DNA-binding beta-propeller fold protein YncE
MMRFISLLLIGCLLTSCATITRGPNEVIAVDSDPSGANATIKCTNNISASGTTPARLTIPRKAEGCRVDVEKSGMKAQSVDLERGFNSAYWTNFFPASGLPIGVITAFRDENTASVAFGVGIIGAAGFLVDRVTGAMYDHNPNVKVKLEPQQ